MKKRKYYLVIILFAMLQFGCGVITNKLYIQDANLESNLNSPPLNITKNKTAGSITLSPNISINTHKKITGLAMEHTRVNSSNVFQVDTIISDGGVSYKESGKNNYNFKGSNMSWNLPDAALGLNLDVAMSNSIAFTAGVKTSLAKKKNTFNGHAGLGYFKGSEKSGVRLEGGVLWQKIFYNVHSVLISSNEEFWGNNKSTIITLMNDKSNKTCFDYYLTFTCNSVSESSLFDFFLSLGAFTQSLLDFEHKTPDEIYYGFVLFPNYYDEEGNESDESAFILFANPGLILNLSEHSRINIGAKIHFITGIDSISDNFVFTPTVQFDVVF